MRLSAILFLIAAVLSLLGVAAHEFFGAPKVLAPLDDADLAPDVIWLHHFSWHVGTVAVLIMIAMFGVAARRQDQLVLAVLASMMASGFALLGICLALFGHTALWGTPAPYAWVPVAVFGWLGVLVARRY